MFGDVRPEASSGGNLRSTVAMAGLPQAGSYYAASEAGGHGCDAYSPGEVTATQSQQRHLR